MDADSRAPSLSSSTYIKIQIALNTITAVFVSIRIITNRLTAGKLLPDDYTSAVALAFVAGFSASSSLITEGFTAADATIERITKISVACIFMGGAAMYFSKTPLLLLYIRIFYVKTWLRLSCYAILATTAIIYLVCAAFSASHCVISSGGNYDAEFQADCIANSLVTALVRCFTSIFCDLLILALPIPVILALNLPASRKTALAVVFLTGIFAIAAACTSLYFQWNMETQSPADITLAMLCTCLECCIAIIVGCAPASHALWSKYLVKTGFIKSLKAMPSYQTRQNTETTSHRYLELENVNKAPSDYQINATSDHSSQK
jgi:hypothetical protein